MIVTQPKSRQILGVNQQSYQSLKASMCLHLRRQLLIAVCDSVVMQDQLATQLEADLAKVRLPSGLPNGFEETGQAAEAVGSVLDEPSAVPLGQGQPLAKLVFDSSDGNLPRQVAQWMRQTMLSEGFLPQVQIVGIEQMTRQPAITQHHFLRSLEKIDALMPRLNTSLLIWLPWPWLRTIQQSAPTFWNWRSGVFEFVSDPTPVSIEPQRIGSQQAEPPLALAPASTQASQASVSKPPMQQPFTPADPDSTELAPTELAHTEPAPTEPAQKTIEDEDLSGLFDEESAPVQLPIIRGLGPASIPTASGGLTSIITKGINADKESSPASVNRSAEGSEELKDAKDANLKRESLEGEKTEVESLKRESLKRERFEEGNLEEIFEEETIVRGNLQESQLKAQTVPHSEIVSAISGDRAEQVALLDSTTSSDEQASSNAKTLLAANAASERPSEEKNALANGRSYRSKIEAGDRSLSTVESAIAAYESGLEKLGENSLDWSAGLNDLGTLYWLKAQQASEPQQGIDCMTRSIELYQAALKQLQPGQEALVGQLYSNMGAVYSMLATYQDSADSLNQAANAYLQAVSTCSLKADPTEYAILHNSLGSVYWKLSHYQQAPNNLLKAIAAYRNALSGYRPDSQPLDYAATQNNLGISYWSLAKHEDPAACLKQAIAAYSDALNYRTPDEDPTACAITYNNMALAYWDLSKVEGLEQSKALQAQKNAVTAFEAALNINRNSGALDNMDSAAIYHCLGDVHGQMAETASAASEISASLSKSLYSYIQSLQGVSETSSAFSGRIGAIVANLRSHYMHLGLEGQQAALNKVPADLISQVLAAL